MQNRSMAPKERLNPPLRTESSNEQYWSGGEVMIIITPPSTGLSLQAAFEDCRRALRIGLKRSGFSKDYHGDTYDPFESSEGQSSGGVVSYPIYSKSINVPPALIFGRSLRPRPGRRLGPLIMMIAMREQLVIRLLCLRCPDLGDLGALIAIAQAILYILS
ncbi:Hypothetical protein FKW44_019113 [Caligus rogercresseyi]|uniref:Uncharacterized protein n=1 Tax=Caligus rogercresseyi TaxID=217165 RepID=A0A7T8GVE0_CALRO|nr:Hypothetical protein FKW44_019113 [Caligus rogercresseyi]